jgi:UDP-glucuronate decarboxylase
LDTGAQVRVIDNLQTGSRENLARAKTTGGLEFVEADVIRPFPCETDLVVNLACAASPPRYQADPIHTMQTNVQGGKSQRNPSNSLFPVTLGDRKVQ